MNYTKNLRNAVLRQDFNSFISKTFSTINPQTDYRHNWHISLIAEYLEAVRNKQIKRLIINMPPRALKSICVSVAWPAWLLAKNPACRILAASYSQTLSLKHSIDCKLVMKSNWYMEVFPNTILSKTHNLKSKYLTTSNGFRFATSVGGSVTGEGGDFLIIDDPHNPIHIHSSKLRHKAINWFEQTFLSRLNDKSSGAIVLVMQRLHEEDLSGHLIQNNQWHHLKIPLKAQENLSYNLGKISYEMKKFENLHNFRDSDENIEKLKYEIGIENFHAQYLQSPLPNKSNVLNLSDLTFYDVTINIFDYYIQSWDTAIKISDNSDYSVGCCFGVLKNNFYLIDMIREKMVYKELKQAIYDFKNKYNPLSILIEDKASGQSIIQDLKLENVKNIVPIIPRFNKLTRLCSVSELFSLGKLKLPKCASYLNIIVEELTNFPKSKHDDIVDCITNFLIYIKFDIKNCSARIRNFD